MSEKENIFSEDNDEPLYYIYFESITIDPSDNDFICSFRNTDSIVKPDIQTGDVIWVLGGEYDVNKLYKCTESVQNYR